MGALANKSLLVLGCMSTIWVPVNLTKPLADAPVIHLLQISVNYLVQRTKQILGSIIARTVSLVLLISSITTSFLALVHFTQTAYSIDN